MSLNSRTLLCLPNISLPSAHRMNRLNLNDYNKVNKFQCCLKGVGACGSIGSGRGRQLSGANFYAIVSRRDEVDEHFERFGQFRHRSVEAKDRQL